MSLTGIFENLDQGTIMSRWAGSVARVSNADVEPTDDDRIFERYRYARQRPFEVDFGLRPLLCLWEHQLGEAVRLRMRLDCNLAIGPKNIDGFGPVLVDFPDQTLD